MTWIMAYVASVPNDREADYLQKSRSIAEVFKAHGATRVVECWGSAVPPGEVTSFPMAVRAEPGETVVMGWQEWPDKATQEAGMQAAMSDPRMAVMQEVPVDGRRMIFAGFDVVVDL